MPRQGAKCERLLFVALELDTRMDLYTKVAEETAAAVIRRYSTSFGMASKLLSPSQRTHICNFYALVRLADEIVDGVAEEAGVSSAEAARVTGCPGGGYRKRTGYWVFNEFNCARFRALREESGSRH
jgi:hypothetical protein